MIETSDMQFDSRMVTAEETPEDHDVEVTLRPQTLAEYIAVSYTHLTLPTNSLV